jgi:hypothetical protein
MSSLASLVASIDQRLAAVRGEIDRLQQTRGGIDQQPRAGQCDIERDDEAAEGEKSCCVPHSPAPPARRGRRLIPRPARPA